MSYNRRLIENPIELLKLFSLEPPELPKREKVIPPNPMTGIETESIVYEKVVPRTTTQEHGQGWNLPEMHQRDDGIEKIIHRKISRGQKIFYADLSQDTTQPYFLKMNIWAEPKAGSDMVPVYFLPWQPGTALELSIPSIETFARDTVEEEDAVQPSLFFTAALSGCTVVIRGSKKNPIILHCGIEKHQIKGTLHDRFWEFLIGSMGGPQSALHRGYYSGKEISDYLRQLASTNQGTDIRVLEANPWGTVFGIRTGEDWKFYLQENASVRYHKITGHTVETRRSGFLHLRKERIGRLLFEEKTIRMPMFIASLFPKGRSTVTMRTRWRRLN